MWKVSKLQKGSKAFNERSNVLGHEDLELSDRLIPHLETNIYDFGVFLLEMVSGRPPHSKEFGSLTEWVRTYPAMTFLECVTALKLPLPMVDFVCRREFI